MASSIRAYAPPALLSRIPKPLRRLTTVLAAIFLAVVLVAALFAPWVAPHGYRERNPADAYRGPGGPGATYPLGTDDAGRCVYSRLVYGAQVSLAVAVVVEAVELVFGLGLGIIAGLRRGWLDNVVMRITDFMFAFPDVLLAILITGTLGKSLINVIVALALVGWPGMVRLVRGQVLGLRDREFVDAARAMGASDIHIIRRHLLPNVLGPVIVAATVGLGGIMLAESTLSFLGLGIQPPFPSWGSMIKEGWELRRSAPLLTVYPAVLLALTIMAFNFLGDGLRDWLDPRSRS